MTTKKRSFTLLLIVLATVCLLTGFLFYTAKKVDPQTASASRDSNGTNTDGEWTGSQQTPNLIPTLKEGSIASQGWKVSSDGNTQVAANTVYENGTYGYVIKSSGNGSDLGGHNYTGGVYYTLTLSEADRAKANAGQLKIGASATFFFQASATHYVSIRVRFFDVGNSQIGDEVKHTHKNYWVAQHHIPRTLDATNVPQGTCSIQVWFSNHGSLDSRPFVANPSCYLYDSTAPSITGNVLLDKISVADSAKNIVVAGNTIKYGVEFNEKVSLVSNGTATITLNGQSYTSSTAEVVTEAGKSRIRYTFTVPSQDKNGTIAFSSVSGLKVKDEAGNTANVTGGSFSSAPTLQYYRAMKVSSSLTHLTFAGEGKATYNTDYKATLSAVRGYNLPEAISVSVGSKALSQGSEFTYESRTGAITIKGANITDDITITAAGVAKKSQVTLHRESGIGGSETTTATFDAAMPTIDAPTRTGYTFQGYYTLSGGAGTKYYDATGKSAKNCDFEEAFELYAYWTANKYTIKFDGNKPDNASGTVQGNTPSSSRTYDEGELPLPENGFTLTGWTFKGWVTPKSGGTTYDDMQAVENLTPDPNGSVTLYAVWEANIYTITLNAMGGTNAGTKQATFDDPLPGITVPEKYGYNFLGYFDASEGGTKYYELSGTAALSKFTVVGGLTLYAQWEAITYTVHLYSEGEFVKDIPNVVYGELKLPSAEECGLSRKNFDFVGWNIYAEQDWKMYSPDTVYLTGLTGTQGDIVVLNASWKEKPIHALYYDANGGYGAPATMQVHEEETITLSEEIPLKNDHTFAGWATSVDSEFVKYHPEDEFTMGDDVVTLYAVWKHNPSLTYDANEGQFNHSIAITYPAPESSVTVTELEPVREGYTFLGWALSIDADTAKYHAKETFSMPAEDTVLYAVWQQRQFTVSQSTAVGYDISGLEEGYSYGEEVKFTVTGADPKVYINGTRVFADGEGNYTYKATEDISVVVADSSSCVLLYSANGGEDAPTDKGFYSKDGEATVSNEIPTRTGYQFVGWSKNKELSPSVSGRSARSLAADDDTLYQGGNNLTFDGEDVTLYAIWEANTYTVNYNANAVGCEGTMSKSAHSYGTAGNLTENVFVREGFIFVGWALSEGGACVFADGDEVLNLTAGNGEEVQLYAVWEKLKTLITFDAAGGGGGSANYMVDYGETLPENGLMAPVRSGYTFAGYFTDLDGEGEMLFDENMRPVNYAASAWHEKELNLTLHAYWIPTPETIEDTIDEVQSNLYTATQQLYAALDDSQTDLEGKLSALDAAYQAADKLLRSDFLSADSNLQDQINSLQRAMDAADDALEVAIKAVEDKLDSAVKDLQSSIEANKNALETELSTLDAAYQAADNVLRSEFASADSKLQDQINSLKSAMETAEKSLQAAIDRVQENLNTAVDNLKSSIEANKNALETELAALKSAYESADRLINSSIAALQAQDSLFAQNIANLESAYQAADERLQDAIDAVEDKLDKAVKDLQAAIEANKTDIEAKVSAMDSAYQAADTLLRSDMTKADEDLESKITALRNTMTAADDALRTAIKGVQDNLDKAVKDLQAAIEANKTDIEDQLAALTFAYQKADAFINIDIAALQAQDSALAQSLFAIDDAFKAADEALQTAIDTVQDKLDKAVEDLQKAIKKNETDIDAKVSALDSAYQTADALLRSELTAADDALENAMNDADEALQTAIDTVQDKLDKAVEDLQKAIEANKTDIEAKVSALDSAYQTADSLLRSELMAADETLENAMNDADEALRTAIKGVQDNLDKAVEDLQEAIEANETDIEAKVSALDSAYQTANSLLRSELTAADEALENAMNDADEALQTAIKGVQDNLDKAVEDLQASIEANETDIEAKVSALDSAYQAANALLHSEMTEADDALDAKITALENAMNAIESTLQTAIKTVQDNLDKAVEDLQASIEANETDIEAKVTALDSAYQAANTLLRSEMTEALESKTDALENAMNAADESLQTAIETVQTNLDKAVEELQNAIEANETGLEAKVSALNSAYRAADVLINSDIAGLKAQDSALAQSIAALDSAYQAADEALWEGIRQVEGKHDALEQENEKTAFTYMIVNSVLGSVAAVMIVTLVVKTVKKKKPQQ